MPPFADPSQLVSQVLSGICASSAPEYDRAMARNLLAEHRLSKSRFQLFSTFAGAMDDLEAIRSAVQRYHANEVRPLVSAGIEPAYTRPENQQNSGISHVRRYQPAKFTAGKRLSEPSIDRPGPTRALSAGDLQGASAL